MKATFRKKLHLTFFHSQKGQGLVETALLMPILLIVLSGLVEFGLMMNYFMVVQDASRNATRFAVDNAYNSRDGNHNCTPTIRVIQTEPEIITETVPATLDFYRQIGCVVNQELAREKPDASIVFTNTLDDVVISVFSIEGGNPPIVSARFPEGEGEAGWSFSLDETSARNQFSQFSSAEVASLLNNSAPSTGYVLVEVFDAYDQILKLPWITAFVPDPVLFHVYTIMPLSSAEPTPTPIP